MRGNRSPQRRLRPDGKSQVTIEYQNGTPKRVEAIVIAAQHDETNISRDEMRKDIIEKVIKPVIPSKMLDENTKFFINETGKVHRRRHTRRLRPYGQKDNC